MHFVQMYSPSLKLWEDIDKYADNTAGYKSACRRYSELLINTGTYYSEIRVILINEDIRTVLTANTADGFEVGE